MSHVTGPDQLRDSLGSANLALELRHLRYLVAVAEAGTFTHAAERMFIAQATISQQIRRLEEMMGAPLLQRRRDGVLLTPAGRVLLEESRTILSLLDHGVRRSRQAAGLGRPRLRFILPPYLPEWLAVQTASRLRFAAATAGADVVWMEAPLDAEFTPLQHRRADAGLGWVTSDGADLPDPLDVMSLGDFAPETWIPSRTGIGHRGVITLDELAHMDVVRMVPRSRVGTYDAWLAVLRTRQPRFDFADPPFRHSLPTTLAFAATARRPTAVLTGPLRALAEQQAHCESEQPADSYGMISVDLEGCPLTATAALAWSGDLPRWLQQVLFDTADSIRPCGSFATAS
jgi:DNA-binding transcriptional LysR family regulator